ncbi:MAG: putative toxin-antitoxin system toxin component, PIN family [Bacilli bacterium]|nr:putative toxin-antitoxin system toxin component, PIN family [Bacilli bacterium]
MKKYALLDLKGKRGSKYYAVIDTNVIVSAFLKEGSIPDQIVSLALNGPIIPLVNDEIISEYTEVLTRNKFGLSESEVKVFLNEFIKRALFLDKTKTNEDFDDPDDIVFYKIILTARSASNAYLITGNKKHYPIKSFVVTPREMIEIIEKDNK